MNPVPIPLPKHLDARQRAVRTFVGSLLSAVLAAVLPVALSLAGEIRWTRTWWLAAGASVGMAALNAGVSYALRYWKPPAS
jgi:hypothetical protein